MTSISKKCVIRGARRRNRARQGPWHPRKPSRSRARGGAAARNKDSQPCAMEDRSKGSRLCAMKGHYGSEISRPCAMKGRSEASQLCATGSHCEDPQPCATKGRSEGSQPCATRGCCEGPRLCETTSRSEDSPLCATRGPGEDLQLCALKARRRVAYARQRIAANSGEEPRRCAARLFAAKATRGRSCRSCRCDCRPRRCGTPRSRRRPRAGSRDRR